MSKEVGIAQFVVGMLLCVQNGNCTNVPTSDLTDLFFLAPNLCLMSHCPEHRRNVENTELVLDLERRIAGVVGEIDEVDGQIKALLNQTELATASPEIASLQSQMAALERRLEQLEVEVAELLTENEMKLPVIQGQSDLAGSIEHNQERIKQLQDQLRDLDAFNSDTQTEVAALIAEVGEWSERLDGLEADIENLHVPEFVGDVFTTDPRVEIGAGECDLIEVTVDVLYESYPYFGGTTYVIVLVNGAPIYGGSLQCDSPMNPAAVTDYTYGAPSRTFYIDEPALLSQPITISYDKCDKTQPGFMQGERQRHLPSVQPHITAKCYQAA